MLLHSYFAIRQVPLCDGSNNIMIYNNNYYYNNKILLSVSNDG